MRWALIIISLLLAWPSNAQDLYSTGTCEQPQADTYLEAGNVRARILNNGSLFWKGSPNVYQIPANGSAQSIFVANLLIGGFIDDEIRASGSTYGPYEFWPGPIPEDGSAPEDCASSDRFWHSDFNDHVRQRPEQSAIPDEVAEWPVHLNAPFIEANGIPGYQPEQGDVPEMRGDRQVWWVMNDRGNEHTRLDSAPLGIEIQASAYGFDSPGDLGNTSFYRYHIINRGSEVIRDVAVGKQIDFELGNFDDDRMGTDTTLAMFYVYNADNDDEGDTGYGSPAPALGFVVLEASHANGSLPTDLGASPERHLTSTAFPYGGGGYRGDIGDAKDAYNYLIGNWKDGSPRTEGGNGSRRSNTPMPYWMPGDPVSGSYWSELNVDGQGDQVQPSDRKGIAGFGTFDLEPGEWATFTFAYVWARGTNHLDSITELRDAARFLHQTKAVLLAPRKAPPGFEHVLSPDEQHPFWVDEPYPNPADDRVTLSMSLKWTAPVAIRVIDTLGREWRNEEFSGTPGLVDRELSTTNLPPGTYLIRVSQRGEHVDHMLVVL